VHWDEQLQLPRIAAALCLRDLSDAKAREALALQYQLVSDETNLILVHERAEADKAEDLPELVQVRPMLAAGWGGNGTVVKAQVEICEYREVSFNDIRFMRRSHHVLDESQSIVSPAVWRSSRTPTAARIDGMANSGTDNIEIPASLRKSTSNGDNAKPTAPVESKPVQNATPQRQSSRQKPQPGPEALTSVLKQPMGAKHPVMLLVNDFNQIALHHTRFRSALAELLRLNPASYLQWLVTRHMAAAGSAAPVWAIFITWSAKTYNLNLDRHAERLLRDFMAGMNERMVELVRGELEAIAFKEPKL
jgi:Ca-activated chloride channel family protein